MNIPGNLRYTKTHEWVSNENGRMRVGITDHAQHEITDVVHVELPSIGKKLTAGQPCAVVESVKSAFDIYAPVTGTITAVNTRLESNPELVNQSPYSDGFFFEVQAADTTVLDALMDATAYEKSIS
jgi:glycine cleavage system H protein